MSEQYGVGGSVMIDIWKREYEEIAGHVKFGGADQDAFLPLMRKISDHMDEQYVKRARWDKIGIVMGLASVIILFSAKLFNENWFVLLLIGIASSVLCFMMKKGREKEILAAIDFDKAYFDGEIVYRRKNGWS